LHMSVSMLLANMGIVRLYSISKEVSNETVNKENRAEVREIPLWL